MKLKDLIPKKLKDKPAKPKRPTDYKETSCQAFPLTK